MASKSAKKDSENEKDIEAIVDEALEENEDIEAVDEASQEDIDDDTSEEDERIEQLENRYKSLYAEYENYRKRTVKEKENLYSDAVADVSSQWLAIIDNIDRAMESIKDNSDENVVKGIEMIGKQASDVMKKIGIEEIPCQRGTAFDPNFHEAVMHLEDDSLGEQEIASVFQKGYIYKERVIRHAVVQVAN